MRRPSILFFNRVYPPSRGATGRVLRDLARRFAREGWEVTVVTTGPKALKERDGAVRIIRVKGAEKPRNMLCYIWIWGKMLLVGLRLPVPQLVVSMTDPPFLVVLGGLLTMVKKSKHMHWCQDLYPDVFPALRVNFPRFVMRWMKRRVRGAMCAADKVIVIGRCMARHLSETGVPAKQMTVIPNWPDGELENFQSGVSDHGSMHERNEYAREHEGVIPRAPIGAMPETGFRVPEEQVKTEQKFRVLYAGNIGLAHPIDTILSTAEILQDTHPEIEFLFVGDGPRYDEIAELRTRKHLDNIRLLPYQPASRLQELMESGDVHLISLKEEAAGMMVPCKLYAGLAAHRPCVFVGPAHSEVAKVITDFAAGVVIPQGHVEQLVEAIVAYRSDADAWFKAQEGAVNAGQVFVPGASIEAWIKRAQSVLEIA